MLLGATFPAAVRICTRAASDAGSGAGRVYAANTAGAIFGSLLAGFVLVPAIGSRGSIVVLAGIFALNGCLLLWQSARRKTSALADPRAIIPLGATAALAVAVLLLPRQTIANYNLQQNSRPELIFTAKASRMRWTSCARPIATSS